jgi:CMP/dCMP kinase
MQDLSALYFNLGIGKKTIMKKLIITIDGPSGSGKSTISRLIAERLCIQYLDTGSMYRAAALQAVRKGVNFSNGPELFNMCQGLDLRFVPDGRNQKIFLSKEEITSEIRSPEMDMLSSKISAVREVRESMTMLQRKVGLSGGLVAEGRDMGTVVFPDADYKFFLTASIPERAQRRYLERLARGESISRDKVEEELCRRDEQDTGRSIAPLRPAADADIIDTTGMGIEQVTEAIYARLGISAPGFI